MVWIPEVHFYREQYEDQKTIGMNELGFCHLKLSRQFTIHYLMHLHYA